MAILGSVNFRENLMRKYLNLSKALIINGGGYLGICKLCIKNSFELILTGKNRENIKT